MIIKDSRKPKTKMFSQFTKGEVFYDTHDTEAFCMKTDLISTDEAEFNAINLKTGSVYFFGDDEEVEAVSATMNVF